MFTVTVCLPSAPGLDASTVALTFPADVLSPAACAWPRVNTMAPASSASAAARFGILCVMRTSSQKLGASGGLGPPTVTDSATALRILARAFAAGLGYTGPRDVHPEEPNHAQAPRTSA